MLTKLNDTVSMIDTEALGKAKVVAAYLVAGKERALIDMGYQSSVETVYADLAEHGVGPDGLDYLLPTHVHLDHSGACGALAKKFPQAKVRVHPKGEAHLADASRLWKGARDLFGDELMTKYGRPEPVDRKRLGVAADDEVIDLGGRQALRVVWTPGHASHHLSYEWENHRVFFTGDAVGVYYPDFPLLVPTTPPPSFDLVQMVESLERICASAPSAFYTPHYGVVANAKDWVTKNVETLEHWRTTIGNLRRKGLTKEEISERLIEDASRTLGRVADSVPDYLRLSVSISVLGFLRGN